ncbi:hypothetical protein [Streptomyces sp. NPDC002788]
MADLLESLRQAAEDEQIAALLARDPATHVTLDDPHALGSLLYRLREVGADEQTAALTARAAAAGHFAQFIKNSDHRNWFRFGQEPDGSAAPSWVWDDLE